MPVFRLHRAATGADAMRRATTTARGRLHLIDAEDTPDEASICEEFLEEQGAKDCLICGVAIGHVGGFGLHYVADVAVAAYSTCLACSGLPPEHLHRLVGAAFERTAGRR